MTQPAPQPKRKTYLELVVGINGTGKTTFLRHNVVKRGRKTLVVTPDEAEWRFLPTVSTAQEIYYLQGAARIVSDGSEEQLQMITRTFYGGSLVFDDAMAYLQFGSTSPVMRYIYIRRRQYGVDIYLVAHGLRQVPVQAFTFGSHLILFATTENFSSRRRELDPATYAAIESAQQQLRTRCANGENYAYQIITLDPTLMHT